MFLNLKTCYEKRIFLTCNFMVCLLNFLPKQLIVLLKNTNNQGVQKQPILWKKSKQLMQIAHYRNPQRVIWCQTTDIYWGYSFFEKMKLYSNVLKRSAKNTAHSTPIRPPLIAVGAFHRGCSLSELWIIKILAFKRAKVPKPHKNQTNNMVHQKNNLTPVGPLWCVVGTGALWLLSW